MENLEEEKLQEEEKGPLHGLIEVYEKMLKEEDDKGFAEVYKKATEQVFCRINQYVKDDIEFHFEDISFGDGYFIFAHGTNSVIHFHVKETPGWLYGLWWYPIKADEYTEENKLYRADKLSMSLFVQYEDEIDKFKPSASTFVVEGEFYFDKKYYTGDIERFARIMKFIHNEPYLAFYREMTYTDFNEEYVSREEAKEYYNKHMSWKERCAEVDRINDQQMIDMVKYIIGPMLEKDEAFIGDHGDCCSPRYEIYIRNDSDAEDVEDGCYGLLDPEDPDYAADKDLWEKTVKECEDRAHEAEHYWFCCFHDNFVYVHKERFNELKALFAEENRLVK